MSRDLNHLASLNTVENENASHDEQNHHEEELQMFSNTTFFDLDMGRSTDIATTVDELLMQQEKQIQYPHKQQPLEEAGPVAGPSYTSRARSEDQAQAHNQQKPIPQRNLPFDFNTLQGFSLAGELPQASLSIYDVDPVFHDQTADMSRQAQSSQDRLHQHQLPRAAIIQRHEVAENYAPRDSAKTGISVLEKPKVQQEHTWHHVTVNAKSAGLDDEKRRRNTAASARFRIKKKMREQEMEKNQKLMQQKLADQAERIKQLEMENSWLKNLVVEKNTARDSTSLGKLREELLQNESK